MKHIFIKRKLSMLLCIVSLSASAYDFEVDGIYYNITSSDDLTVEVTSGSYSGQISIPETVEYNGKSFCVTSIGEYSFSNCSALTSVTIPNSVTSIGNYAFMMCNNLTSVTIPTNVTTIGEYAFYGCITLTSITIPDTVTSIGRLAFYDCIGLTSVTIGNSVTSIESSVFSGCSGLTSVTIPNSVVSISSCAFSGCSGFTSITIPNSVTSIGDSAFSGCINLSFVSLGSGLNTIGGGVFYNCNPSLTVSFSSKEIKSWFTSGMNNNSISEVILTDSVEIINEHAFNGCTNLKSVKMGDNVKTLGNYAFVGCNSLTSLTLSDSLESIGNSAFYGCNSLTSLTLPNSLESIGISAFYGCSSLSAVTMPKCVKNIGSYAFSGCTSLENVVIPDLSSWCRISFGDQYSTPLYYAHHFMTEVGKQVTDLTIPNDVDSIKAYAFYGCSDFNSLNIQNNVTYISDYAFGDCNFKSLTVGAGVLTIGGNIKATKTFWLTNTPPTGYTNVLGKINYVANDSYTSLSNKKVYPFLSSMFDVDGVKYVPVSPSERICDVIDCIYDSTRTSITIDSTVVYRGVLMKVNNIQPYTCYQNTYLKDAVLNITGEISKYAFYGCSAIETVTISNSISSIAESAFQGCTSLSRFGPDTFMKGTILEGIQLPGTLISVGYNAFSGCSKVKTVMVLHRNGVIPASCRASRRSLK